MSKSRKYLRHTMRLVADDNCQSCCGTGIKATNRYSEVNRKLDVTFEICWCVRIKPIGLMLPIKTADVTVSAVTGE